MTQDFGVREAVEIAMEAELKAQAFYAQAAVEVQDPHGRDLLGRLAAFEGYHYEQLAKLARSLQEDSAGRRARTIEYETRTISDFQPAGNLAPLGISGEAGSTQLQELEDVAAILGKAIENEKVAGERYRALADETADPDGIGHAAHAMFRKLGNEEMIHQRILEDEFFSLSNKGVWGWSGLYGE